MSNIVFRSSWELRVFKWCDNNPNVLRWASEEIVIRYRAPLDQQMHRYFPDVWVEVRAADGSVRQSILEIKPDAQTRPPVAKKGKRKSVHAREVARWLVNEAKWNAAKEFCEQRGLQFFLVTEKTLRL